MAFLGACSCSGKVKLVTNIASFAVHADVVLSALRGSRRGSEKATSGEDAKCGIGMRVPSSSLKQGRNGMGSLFGCIILPVPKMQNGAEVRARKVMYT